MGPSGVEITWRRAAKIARCWVIGLTAGYLAVFFVVRFILLQEYLLLVGLPGAGVLLAWVSPLALGQLYNSWKVAWSAFLCCLVAVPVVLALVFGVFFAIASPR